MAAWRCPRPMARESACALRHHPLDLLVLPEACRPPASFARPSAPPPGNPRPSRRKACYRHSGEGAPPPVGHSTHRPFPLSSDRGLEPAATACYGIGAVLFNVRKRPSKAASPTSRPSGGDGRTVPIAIGRRNRLSRTGMADSSGIVAPRTAAAIKSCLSGRAAVGPVQRYVPPGRSREALTRRSSLTITPKS